MEPVMRTNTFHWLRFATSAAVFLSLGVIAAAQQYKAGSIVIEQPWIRATAGGAKVAGGYMTITNTGSEPDHLVDGELQQAGRVEIHEMKMDGNVMRMRAIQGGLEIKPGEKVQLNPDGFHVMFMELRAPLKEGDRVKGRLRFEKAGSVDVEYRVESIGAKTPHHHSRSEKGGPFALVDHYGKSVTDRDYLGKPSLVFFGFTNCPNVCPSTLMEITNLLQELGPDAGRLNVLFITVDPERDTPQQLASYLSSFDPRIIGLSGSPENIRAAMNGYQVFAEKVPLGNGDYTMDHTATISMMDSAGRYAGAMHYLASASVTRAKLHRLLNLRPE
jgi:protein SCO1